MSDPVREFLMRTFIGAGGLVDDSQHGLEALLPLESAKRMGLPDELSINLSGSEVSPGDTRSTAVSGRRSSRDWSRRGSSEHRSPPSRCPQGYSRRCPSICPFC
jgi:hypothetical protein